ncbi:heme o synthase [Falsarthrobacter nasiphocae]|uniref:heme o synthase n=1 Tax=Falsarthrobacter nasiphocae TaxID=189863 RepID=UPI00286CE752|nr:heme o synthase [Falsarthrobacter nasiphocae]
MSQPAKPRVETAEEPVWRRKAKAYISLTKPQVVELLLVTTLPTMIFALGGMPPWTVILATMVGGAFAAGSASAFNCYLDRDIDKLMHRTERRPLVTGELTPRQAFVFASVLGVLAIAILAVGANALAAWLGVAAIFFYVVIYTMILKRRTSQNIIWGGAAGCFPVLIAWAAATGTLAPGAWVLFLVIFLWTPPHYWPLSMKYGEDYRNADVPMLGAFAGGRIVSAQVVLYAWATVICSLLLVPVAGAGWLYGIAALASGGWFLYKSHRLRSLAVSERMTNGSAMSVFHGSIVYLSVLFLALALDPFATRLLGL